MKRKPLAKTADDAQPTISTRTDAQLRDDILELLATGPLLKWELRTRLHESETRLLKILTACRRAGLVKIIGSRLDRRRWALIAWLDDPATPSLHGVSFEPKREMSAESWWTKHASREATFDDFSNAAKRRDTEMASSSEWRRLRVGGFGDGGT